MYIVYDDILSRVQGRPRWWLNGFPRYRPFTPNDVGVYEHEVALVHTECQGCGMRYDVAVKSGRLGRSLRNVIAYENQLDIGDPPNACRFLGRDCSAGAVMSSFQIAVVEYWTRDSALTRDWRRDESMERPLVDADWRGIATEIPEAPIFLRIYQSTQKDDWQRARNEGDFSTMASILSAFGCERPREVAHMLDLERRQKLLNDEAIELARARFGEP